MSRKNKLRRPDLHTQDFNNPEEWKEELERDYLTSIEADRVRTDPPVEPEETRVSISPVVKELRMKVNRDSAFCKEHLPEHLPYFQVIRNGRYLRCPHCEVTRPIDTFEFPNEDPDLVICGDCDTVGYTLILRVEDSKDIQANA